MGRAKPTLCPGPLEQEGLGKLNPRAPGKSRRKSKTGKGAVRFLKQVEVGNRLPRSRRKRASGPWAVGAMCRKIDAGRSIPFGPGLPVSGNVSLV